MCYWVPSNSGYSLILRSYCQKGEIIYNLHVKCPKLWQSESQSSCYISNADLWCLFSLGQKPCSQLYPTKETEENFRADWSGHYKMHLWKHPCQYVHSYLMLLLEVYALHMKNFCKYLPKAFMVKISANTWKIQNWTILMRPCSLSLQKGRPIQNNPHCFSLGCINTQLIKIICQTALQTTQWNVSAPIGEVTETPENLDHDFASIIAFQIAQERKGEAMQYTPNDQGILSGKANTKVWNHHTWLPNSTVTTR